MIVVSGRAVALACGWRGREPVSGMLLTAAGLAVLGMHPAALALGFVLLLGVIGAGLGCFYAAQQCGDHGIGTPPAGGCGLGAC